MATELPRVLFTGSRNWPYYYQVLEVMRRLQTLLGPYIAMHGVARGLDTFADIAAGVLDLDTDPMPAQWDLYGKAAGPLRNTAMLRKRPVVVVAFWCGDSAGTFDCLEKAVNTFRVPLLLYRS